jgi:hypothetical protein
MKTTINYYIIALLTLIGSFLGFTSCLNEDGVFEENGNHSIVELVLPARSTSTPYAVKTITVAATADVVELPVEINFTGVNGTPDDVQVTLSIDDAAVAIYDNTGTTVALPASNYELPASNVVTIAKGKKQATYIIKLKPQSFDTSKAYALGVKITNASAGTISGNYSTGIYKLSVQ